MWKFFSDHWGVLLGSLAISTAAIFLLLTIAVPRVLLRLPARFFLDEDEPPKTLAVFVTRNFFGGLLVLFGPIVMTPLFWFPPGTGFVLMIVGVILMEFPGRRRLLRHFLKLPKVAERLNSFRIRHGLDEFAIEPDSSDLDR